MNNLFYYTLSEKPETKQNIKPNLFASLKTGMLAQCYADSHSKMIAYKYLIEHNFDVPKEHDIWRTIDESYEYYQQFAKTSQREVHPQAHNQNQ